MYPKVCMYPNELLIINFVHCEDIKNWKRTDFQFPDSLSEIQPQFTITFNHYFEIILPLRWKLQKIMEISHVLST